MNSQMYLFILLSFIFLSLSPSSEGLIAVGNKIVDSFCSHQGTKSDFCYDVFKADNRSASTQDMFTLFQVGVERGLANVTKNRDYFRGMEKVMPEFKATLQFCVSRYDGVVKILRAAMTRPLNCTRDLKSMSYDIALAYGYAAQCSLSLEDDGITDACVVKRSQDVTDYTWLVYNVITALVKKTNFLPPSPSPSSPLRAVSPSASPLGSLSPTLPPLQSQAPSSSPLRSASPSSSPLGSPSPTSSPLQSQSPSPSTSPSPTPAPPRDLF